ncbi:uncharacterized protein LOC116198095 isoform X1 [Punica granatum]|uniref:Uncharacterized protein LOC116198095 isoform X1 n=2 Tax=Punica granatum TaxID=22663 RepID=A0A6P8CJG9_PUNGR|nr:uncharacterized protein LOC116198095 isoform X1 [Punica granatum]
MASSFQVVKSTLTAVSASVPRTKFGAPGLRSGGGCCCWSPPPRVVREGTLRVSCKAQEGDKQSSGAGEEPPESLFIKELRRRGMTPTSILEESKRINEGSDDGFQGERDFSRSNAVSTDPGTNLTNQREQSMALNSEGLEGLIPRAKLLLTIGSTFFLGFGPLILITVAFFSVLYLYFGPTFIHDASKMQMSPPQYIDPYELLEDERISQMAPPVK